MEGLPGKSPAEMELVSFVISRLCCSLEVLRTPHSSNCLTGRRQEPGQSPITCQLAANQACRLLSSHHVNTVAFFLGLSDWLSQGKMLVWIIYPAQPGAWRAAPLEEVTTEEVWPSCQTTAGRSVSSESWTGGDRAHTYYRGGLSLHQPVVVGPERRVTFLLQN